MKKLLYTLLCVGLWTAMPMLSSAQVTANFSAANTSGCSPIVVQFTDQSTGNPTSWSWNLGNGTTSTLQNPSTIYVNPGTYTVKLTVSNGTSSNTKTLVNYITVLPSPDVNFTVSDSNAACAPETVQFTNLSVPGGSGTVNYSWDFGDGNTSTAVNPAHTYQNAGDYDVTLVVTNSDGCVSSLVKSHYVQTIPLSSLSFTATNNNSCTVPATVTFNNTSTNAVSYQWNFGDGSPTSNATDPTHTYTTTGSYTVILIATNSLGCMDTLTSTSFVNIGNLNTSFTHTPATACTGNGVSFSNTSTPGPGNSTWSFGDGGTSTATNPTHVYSTAGVYTVKLVVNYNNCSDSATSTITVNTGPTVAFTASPTYNCLAPLPVQFTNTTTGGVSYLWEFGDGGTATAMSPSYTYNAAGTYSVVLIATSSNGCTDTLTKNNYVIIAPPVAVITTNPAKGCFPLNVTYTTALNPSATPVSSTINFGDGSTGTTASGTHTYTTAGTYVMTYTYTLSGGCTDSAQTTILVGTPPVVNFTDTPTSVCPGQAVTFTNTTTGATSYNWAFGDGGTSTQTSPVYTYETPGSYTAVLSATNNGCTVTDTAHIRVKVPLASFSFTDTCGNRLQIDFHNTTLSATSWEWEFGDGTTSTALNPVHIFPAYGSQDVTLVVTNDTTGCTDSTAYDIFLFADPLTQLTANDTTLCKNGSITLTASPSSCCYTSGFTWSFGDGSATTTTTANTTSHDYTNAGSYTVAVSVTDAYGCHDTLAKTDYINVGGATPAFTGTPLGGCAPLSVDFQDQSTDAPGINITSRLWKFGDGSVNTGDNTNVSDIYTADGTYSVTLVTTDMYGCIDSLKKTNYITVSKPVAQFTAADTVICPGLGVAFTSTSTGEGTLSYSWVFGDGGTSTVANPSHTYNATGNYTVRLIVTSSNGCPDTLTRTAYIHVDTLNLGFSLSDSFSICPPLSVDITNTSTGTNTYMWQFGNGSASTLANPNTIYTYPGTYTVKMIAQNNLGCVDSLSKEVVVLGPTGTLTYSTTNGCEPLTVLLSSVSQNTTSYTWDMNNGYTMTTTNPNFTYTYTQSGEYTPVLVLSNGTCQVPIVGSTAITVDNVSAGFSFSPDTICQSGTVNFTDTAYSTISSINSRQWTFGDGSTSTAHNPSHFYAAPGTYTVRLIIGNATGCLDTLTKQLIVFPLPVVSAGGPQSFCQGQTTPVELQATGAASYTWQPPATGLSCTACANPTTLPAATTTYTVIGVDTNGCMNTATVTVTVNPLPVVSAGNNQTVCNNASAQLQATGAVSYVWSPAAAGLSCTTCSNPIATPATTTTYTVTGTNASGCSDTSSVTVAISPALNITAGPNQTICMGSSTQLQATGGNTYTWSPAMGLSCNSCSNPIADPASSTTYTITGYNAIGCSNTGQITIVVDPLPVINAIGTQTICHGQTDSVQLEASGGNTYSWSPAAGLSCTNCTGPTALPTVTTTYTVTGTLTAGCSDTASVVVTVSLPPVVSAGNNQTICSGSSTTLNATGAQTYSWSPAVGLSCSTCASTNASPDTTTTYTVTGTSANGCSDTSSVTVAVNPALNVSAGANQSICSGDTAQLSATGASTYSWAPTAGLSCTTCYNPVAAPSATTTYVVTGAGGNGCTDTAHVTVTINPLPVVAAANQTTCSGTSVQLNATGANTYSWSPAVGLSCTACANPVANPGATTIYTITGTSASGCIDSSHTTVTVDTLPVINAGNNQSICSGTSAQLNATGGTTYIWSPATGLSCSACASTTASPVNTTTYTVTGTSTGGCSDTSQVTVTILPFPVLSTAGNQSICSGAAAQLSVTGAVTYSWLPATGLSCNTCDSPVASPAATTAYTVTGTGGNGCTDTAHVTVTVNSLPVITAANEHVCSGSPVQLQATGAVSYSWSPVTGLSCASCANPLASPLATITYTVAGVNASGCIDSTHVTVTVDTVPVVSAGNGQSVCSGKTAQLQAAGAVNYFWSPATGLSCTSCADPLATPLHTTTYLVTGTDTKGCSDTSHVTVTILPLPVVSAGVPQSVCKGDSIQLNATGAVSYSWLPVAGLSCAGCANPVATPTGPVTYTVTGTGGNGCTDTASIAVSIYPQPVISGGPAQTECEGTPVQLNATGGQTYSWSPATYLSCTSCADPYANAMGNITYTVTGTNADGCTDSGTVSVTVIQPVTTSIGPGDTICVGQSAQLSATGGTTYQWLPATGLNNDEIANPTATPDATITYMALITENQCFTDTGYVTVVVDPLPTVNMGAGQGVIAGGGITLAPQVTGDISSYMWTPATGLSCDTCANPIASPSATVTYTLIVTTTTGCKASGEITITVGCDPSQIFIPNTFTPNGDGVNDRFYISGKGISVIRRFSVYDRWGEQIFEADDIPVNDPMRGWDGTYKGKQLSPDVYVYMVDAICETGQPLEFKGDISLVR